VPVPSLMTDEAVTTPTRTVRVRTEVAALDKTFDYAVPARWTDDVRVGTRVRVPLHGRSVRGWAVEVDVETPGGIGLLPVKSWLGWGPPADLIELAAWASWRWAGPISFFLHAASPSVVVRALPEPPPLPAAPFSGSLVGAAGEELAGALAGPGATVVRLPPATDLIDLVLSVVGDPDTRARGGSVVVLVPSTGWAERLTARLVRRGCPATSTWDEARAGWPVVVASRAGAWAPVPQLAAAVVLDAHDASYREESAPTYSAVDVLLERARRRGAPCVLASPVPPVALAALEGIRTVAPPAPTERAGWPTLERVDRRGADPRSGMFSEEFVRLARAVLDDPAAVATRGPLVCVYNRTGGARLLACSHCGELAGCTRCGAATGRPRDEEVLRCPRCDETRPVVCAACGRLRMKTLRAGVSRLREELEALLGVAVGEVVGPSGGGVEPAVPATPVLVGTEAVLHRVRHAAAVVFLDIDLHLLAPRLSATEDTLALFVRAARLVGARATAARWVRVQAQTRVPDHPVLQAMSKGEPARVLADEVAIRRVSALPPFAALALVSGTLAPDYAAALAHEAEAVATSASVSVSPLGEDRFLVRAAAHAPLCDLFARVPRPPGRGLRIEVDPVTL
jgi:primosomal protein N' (replication factor Y) (superfamily II helicase)